MVFVPIKIDEEKGKICQEIFFHDFFFVSWLVNISELNKKTSGGKVSISEVANFDKRDGRSYQYYQSCTLRHSGSLNNLVLK